MDPTGEWQFRWDHWYAGTVYLNRTETEWVLLGGELAEGLALIPVVGDALAIGDAAYAVAAASAIALGGCLSVMTTGWPGVYYDEESGCY